MMAGGLLILAVTVGSWVAPGPPPPAAPIRLPITLER